MTFNQKMTAAGCLALLVAYPQINAEEKPVLGTEAAKASYAIGVDTARNIRRQGLEVDLDLLIKGLKDGISGEKLLIPEKELRQTTIEIQHAQIRKQRAYGRTPTEANRHRGEDFLEQNKAKPGVTALPSGIQYKVLKNGEGQKPAETNSVECFYRATHLDGAEFISTGPGQPATFKISEAPVPALREVLQLMAPGSKWQLFVPPQFAYGAQGVGRDVGPNETLIFELELVKIK